MAFDRAGSHAGVDRAIGKGIARALRCALFAVGALLLAGRGAAAESALSNVQFSADFTKTQILLSLANPGAFRVSTEADPPRARVSFDALAVAPSAAAGKGFGLVRGFHAERDATGRPALVFDLIQAATVTRSYTLLPAPGRPSRIVIELTPGDPIAMAAALGAPADPPKADSPQAEPIQQASFTPPAPPRPPVTSPSTPRPTVLPAPTRERPEPKPPRERPQAALPAANGQKRIIVVDPGHGGIDPGADAVSGYHEKQITLATARALRRALEATGRYRVVLTRNSDIYLKLRERVARARAAHANLFVSLHADSLGSGGAVPVADRSARGASVYTLSAKASDAESDRIAQRENRADSIGGVDLTDQTDDVAGILVDLTVRETMSEGNRFAGMLVDTLGSGGVDLFPRDPHRSAGFAVLKAPDIPSVLVEMGYLSDQGQARDLASAAYQERIARAIAAGIDRYFAWVDSAGL